MYSCSRVVATRPGKLQATTSTTCRPRETPNDTNTHIRKSPCTHMQIYIKKNISNAWMYIMCKEVRVPCCGYRVAVRLRNSFFQKPCDDFKNL
mmetsp:Transcript_18924/g.30175  ORF Transcript_18924/g.30175 Transcript_18924/m.30175 type:complete len:93 (+) Transcript_18924:47-325(+)